MSTLKVRPIRRFRAELTVPGDKSISHRAAILSGLAEGTTRISGFLNSEDCLCTLEIMRALGARVEQVGESDYIVEGCAGKLLKPAEALDCGNSGTSMRLLAGLLAPQPFSSTLFGDASLSQRPMKRIVDPLTQMGARIECEGENFRPPLRINGHRLKPISYQTPVSSAQVKSCILLAGLQSRGKTEVAEPTPSRDHTERMLQHFGASITHEGNHVTLYGGDVLHARDVSVPGDFSSAAFWLAAASVLPGASLVLRNIGLNPTRTGLLNALMRMGVKIVETVEAPDAEPSGTIIIQQGGGLHATEIGGSEIPNLIDELPVIAVVATLAKGTTIIRDAEELRVKETDRIAALATNLRAFGVPVEERPDGLIIEGGKKLHGAHVQSYGDHRIAMAFAILGLSCKGETLIENTQCIATSYPSFEKVLGLIMNNQELTAV